MKVVFTQTRKQLYECHTEMFRVTRCNLRCSLGTWNGTGPGVCHLFMDKNSTAQQVTSNGLTALIQLRQLAP